MKKVLSFFLCTILSIILSLGVAASEIEVPPVLNQANFNDLTTFENAYDDDQEVYKIYSGLLIYENCKENAPKVTALYNPAASTYYVDISKTDDANVDFEFAFNSSNGPYEPYINLKVLETKGINEITLDNNLFMPHYDTYFSKENAVNRDISACYWVIRGKLNDQDQLETPLEEIYAKFEASDASGNVRKIIVGYYPEFPKSSDSRSNPQPTDNGTNTVATIDKLKLAQKEGKGFVPVKVYNSANAISVDTMRYIGTLSDKVGLEVTNGDATFKFTGGFKLNEQGRLYYPLAYEPNSKYEADMLKFFAKPEAKTDTCKLGGEYTLPKAATITVKTTLPEGAEAYIYNYVAEPFPGKMTLVGKSKVVSGKLTFETKTFGEFMFTTEKIG